MAFPINPVNGQQATVNGVVYTYADPPGVWQVTTNFQGNDYTANLITANTVNATTLSGTTVNASIVSAVGNIISASSISATGNIIGSYVSGNGVGVTGVTGISNGTSNITVVANGNVNTAINGNVVTVVSSIGLQTQFVTSPRTITSNTAITNGTNAMSAGPIIIADGVVVTVEPGGEWSVV